VSRDEELKLVTLQDQALKYVKRPSSKVNLNNFSFNKIWENVLSWCCYDLVGYVYQDFVKILLCVTFEGGLSSFVELFLYMYWNWGSLNLSCNYWHFLCLVI
jgi:hypothetical protein